MQKPLGGQRLGSGGNMNIDLHNFGRSNHNLTKDFRSSLAPGVLYPAYVNVGLNGDKFKFDIKSITRTLPTKGPLFGSFKMQVDMFVCPIRLYHGVLHNNPINIGLNMSQVKIPSFRAFTQTKKNGMHLTKQIATTNLWKYLGLSGLGRVVDTGLSEQFTSRTIPFGIPLLAYYDIFKNYYSNKQEENAYVISNSEKIESKLEQSYQQGGSTMIMIVDSPTENNSGMSLENGYKINLGTGVTATIFGEDLVDSDGNIQLNIYRYTSTNTVEKISNANLESYLEIYAITSGKIEITSTGQYSFFLQQKTTEIEKQLGLTAFPLENFDKMREALLNIRLGEQFEIADKATELGIGLPYTLNSFRSGLYSNLQAPMCGLMVKTYQSDIFNNWLNSETITGSNGIAEITTVDTTNGLQMDALNLAQKVYNMLNRIAVAGGTYEDWQEAVYSQKTIRKAETPIYVGGMSTEIYFEEVIATTAAETSQDGQQSLGSLGGRGKEMNQKGGTVEFEIEEPSVIMAIVSLTPRVTYSQGNKWFLTEIQSIDDLHKPDLDGIGFQDLLVERMAWNGTTIDQNGTIIKRLSAGKSVAWIDYQTDVDECYGDFADEEGKAFMVLNRNYNIEATETQVLEPTDITTYIDPAKFNYAFAYSEIDAQNFWTEILFKCEARRVMSAKQIPNL